MCQLYVKQNAVKDTMSRRKIEASDMRQQKITLTTKIEHRILKKTGRNFLCH